jgi:hypothetical protein
MMSEGWRPQSEKTSCSGIDLFRVEAWRSSFNARWSRQSSQDEKKPELVNIKGTVRADGNKITFVADDTGKAWDVINPETLKAHVGHHVELSAHVYLDKGQIHVMKVTML